MRVLLIPAVVAGVFVVPGSDEPSQAAMRAAVQATLSAQVQSALAYVAETGGEDALARVRGARTDTFDVRGFTKFDCATRERGHVCGFSLRVGVVTGELQRTMKGRFYAGPRGLVFEDSAG